MRTETRAYSGLDLTALSTRRMLLIRNTESVIQIQVPFLTPGEYHLEIRNRNRKTTLFTNRWEDTLTIEV
jgi:hypothetical protein